MAGTVLAGGCGTDVPTEVEDPAPSGPTIAELRVASVPSDLDLDEDLPELVVEVLGSDGESWMEPVEVTVEVEDDAVGVLVGTTTRTTADGAVRFDDLAFVASGDHRLVFRVEEVAATTDAISVRFRLTQISAGFHRTCGVTESRNLYCWGYNSEGTLGVGTQRDRFRPVRIGASVAPFHRVAVGEAAQCARSGFAVYCWGYNSEGQLGVGDALATCSGSATRGTGSSTVPIRRSPTKTSSLTARRPAPLRLAMRTAGGPSRVVAPTP
jgi:hypothetical protein